MTDFLSLPSRERADILAGAGDELGIPPGALEKDIWIRFAGGPRKDGEGGDLPR